MRKGLMIIFFIGLVVLAACAPGPDAGVGPQAPESILRQFETFANARDMEALAALSTDDVVFARVEAADWEDFMTHWFEYVGTEVTLEISNIQTAGELTTLEIKWFLAGEWFSTQTWEATFEGGKIKTLIFVEEIDGAAE